MTLAKSSLNGELGIMEPMDTARHYSEKAICRASEYGVGAVLEISVNDKMSKDNIYYPAFNINFSGMEFKLHAEQLAIFNMLLDMRTAEPVEELKSRWDTGEITEWSSSKEEWKRSLIDSIKIERLYVATSEMDGASPCGHCIQTLIGACSFLNCDRSDVSILTVEEKSRPHGNGGTAKYVEGTKLDDIISTTYLEQ